jgi:AcrR family transcriptional regulator
LTVVALSRRTIKKERTRRQIIEVGIKLFAKHGIDAVTVDQLAAAADVGKGTIYNYFRTKEDIVVAFMADVEQKIQDTLRKISTEGPLADVLMQFIRAQLRLKAPYHQFVRVFFAQMFLHSEQFLPYMAEIHALLTPNIEALFQALQRSGTVRAELDVSDLALVFNHLQFGLTALWAVESPPFQGTELIMQREIALFCRGLGAPTP